MQTFANEILCLIRTKWRKENQLVNLQLSKSLSGERIQHLNRHFGDRKTCAKCIKNEQHPEWNCNDPRQWNAQSHWKCLRKDTQRNIFPYNLKWRVEEGNMVPRRILKILKGHTGMRWNSEEKAFVYFILGMGVFPTGRLQLSGSSTHHCRMSSYVVNGSRSSLANLHRWHHPCLVSRWTSKFGFQSK